MKTRKFMTAKQAILKTKRLILRPWQEKDLEPFAKLNSDIHVMEYFPSTFSPQESNALAKRISTKIDEQGWGFWAVSVPGIAEFIGFIGLNKPIFDAHFTPVVEIGWRLDYNFWGQGYATEGAMACLEFGFETLNLDEIVSFTTTQNMRSRRIMEKIGMSYDPKDDFDHPMLPEDHSLKRHVLYRLKNQEWKNRR